MNDEWLSIKRLNICIVTQTIIKGPNKTKLWSINQCINTYHSGPTHNKAFPESVYGLKFFLKNTIQSTKSSTEDYLVFNEFRGK